MTDPVYYTQPWRAEMSLNARKEQVFEYACHEGNYAMAGILGGARSQEAQGIKPSMGPGIFPGPRSQRRPSPAKAAPSRSIGLWAHLVEHRRALLAVT